MLGRVKKKKKQIMGRQKMKIKPIESEEKRQVCFSSLRTGLFKSAKELSILCGAEVGILLFSPDGKLFTIGHPDGGEVVNRFLNQRHAELIEAERRRCEDLAAALDEVSIEGLGIGELQSYLKALERVRGEVKRRAAELTPAVVEEAQIGGGITGEMPTPPPPAVGGFKRTFS